MTVVFRNVRKVFSGGTVALDSLNLSFDEGEFVVLLGPSGSGKSTACRILAGLEAPSSGVIEVGGRDITQLAPRYRGMSMVFQNYALYPHKSVFANIAYPLKVRGHGKAEIERSVREVAAMLRIDHLLGRRPKQLSGGEAQRVAVARALVWQPEICLMDEPLSNLDALLRLRTRLELKRIHAELKKTFVFVTHDQEEAMSLGTRIAVLHRGQLMQFGTPHEVYHRPAARFVAEFIGRPAMNTIEGELVDGVFRAKGLEVALPERAGEKAGDEAHRGPVVLGIRPEDMEVHGAEAPGRQPMTVDMVDVIEPDALMSLSAGGASLTARMTARAASELPGVGGRVYVAMPLAALHRFAAGDGRRLA